MHQDSSPAETNEADHECCLLRHDRKSLWLEETKLVFKLNLFESKFLDFSLSGLNDAPPVQAFDYSHIFVPVFIVCGVMG